MHGISLPLTLAALAAIAGLGVIAHALWIRGRARERPRCPGPRRRLIPLVRKGCWYELPELREGSYDMCPECGTYVASRKEALRTRRYWGEAVAGLVVFGAAVGVPGYRLASASKWWEVAPLTVTIVWLELNDEHANVDSPVFEFACTSAGGGAARDWQEDYFARHLAKGMRSTDQAFHEKSTWQAYQNFPGNEIVQTAAMEELRARTFNDRRLGKVSHLVGLVGHSGTSEAFALLRAKRDELGIRGYVIAIALASPEEAFPELLEYASGAAEQPIRNWDYAHNALWALGLCRAPEEHEAFDLLSSMTGTYVDMLPGIAEVSASGLRGDNYAEVLATQAVSDAPEKLREWCGEFLQLLGPRSTAAVHMAPELLESELWSAQMAGVMMLWHDRAAARRYRNDLQNYVDSNAASLPRQKAAWLLRVLQ